MQTKNMELKNIVLDDFNRSILKNVKLKTKSNHRLFLCNRYSAKTEDVVFFELTERGAFFKVEDKDVLSCVTKCYLNNFPIREGNEYYSPIYSKVGSLGVVLFEATSPENVIISGPREAYIEKSMYALGQGILSNLCHVENTMDKRKYDFTIDNKRAYVYEYLPFANRRDCVCMFINIKDLVNVHSSLSEADMFDKLHEFSEKIKNIVTSHYGVVNSIFGGGALAIFNVLLYEEINVACRRAICAAVQIRKEIEKKFHIDTYVGIGGNVGEAFFFDFGNPYNYTCFGGIVSKTKKIENVSGRNVVFAGGRTLATDSEHIMLSESIYSKLDAELKALFRDLNVPKTLYAEKLYGLPSETKINSCGNPPRFCICPTCPNIPIVRESNYA